ncbi:MAG: hypothetical protein KJ069_16405 [Anaerolineae bacterium]|nr:hypothetical protein [Anaerolineae bacterium]
MINERYALQEVFTPTQPARANFVERKNVNEKLVKALVTPGKQIVVYGHSGCGKTTLLVNKLHQFYEDHIVTRCTNTMSFEQIMLNGFDQLNPFYNIEQVKSNNTKISSAISSEYALIKAQIGGEYSDSSETKMQRIIPPQLTVQTLARLLGEAKCCWVLEDFHKIARSEKTKLAQSMKLFMDMSDIYASLKIIAIGAVNTAREVIEYDAEMRNRVAEIQVPLMNAVELTEIVDKGQQLLNFSLRPSVKKSIVNYSNGLAAVCHQLCFNICFAAGITETLPERVMISDKELQQALEAYIEEASDTVKSAFDKALRQRKRQYENGKLILQALIKADISGARHSEILAEIRKKEPGYPPSNLTSYLHQLQTEKKGKLLRYDSASGKYSFADPIYRFFATAVLAQEPGSVVSTLQDNFIISLSDEMKKSLSEMIVKISKDIVTTYIQSTTSGSTSF